MSAAGISYFEGNSRVWDRRPVRLSSGGGRNPPPQRDPHRREPPEDPPGPKGSRYDIAIIGGLIWSAASLAAFMASSTAGFVVLAGAAAYALFLGTEYITSRRYARLRGEQNAPRLKDKVAQAIGTSIVAAYVALPLGFAAAAVEASAPSLTQSADRPNTASFDTSFLNNPRYPLESRP